MSYKKIRFILALGSGDARLRGFVWLAEYSRASQGERQEVRVCVVTEVGGCPPSSYKAPGFDLRSPPSGTYLILITSHWHRLKHHSHITFLPLNISQ